MKNESKLGIIAWYDNDEGMITDVDTGIQYYIHESALPKLYPSPVLKGMLVKYSLYTNLYMTQVDSISFDVKSEDLPVSSPGTSWAVKYNTFLHSLLERKLINIPTINRLKIFEN